MTKKVKQAVELFHGKEHYNCAQAITSAFAEENVNVEDYKKFGSGKAPDNTCGAVYAGLLLLDEKQREQFKQEFEAQTGSFKCRELKKTWKVPCTECIRISAEMLEKVMLHQTISQNIDNE